MYLQTSIALANTVPITVHAPYFVGLRVPNLTVSVFFQRVSADGRRCLVTLGIGGYKFINVREVGEQPAGLVTLFY
ncbi:hypothetical protein DNK06_16160 [Pseudomonas daroniae]|uniref:Uncharacterized protein n=1 Tax=Phytopseudomonas daroniae TaxID=2487519 RepID=A0A4Q9QJA9_9GAMM|nr:hypothetical protein DNK06_16160 [Pseudomonas daroniae]TBU81393.1 hypothetical protein DNK31_14875 [Pseudomonas sp. FRB 228]TBU90401.1 hypothetical protein DNJ99_13220 [Pseudomonas daroniae]